MKELLAKLGRWLVKRCADAEEPVDMGGSSIFQDSDNWRPIDTEALRRALTDMYLKHNVPDPYRASRGRDYDA